MGKTGTLPYRNNISCILFKGDRFLVVQLADWKKNWWKFPQGGIDDGESDEETIKRELFEELNIRNFKIVGKSKYTNRYDWPPELQLKRGAKWRGQFQKFYLVEFMGEESEIKNNIEEIRKYKWIGKSEIATVISGIAALSGDYKNIIEKILWEFQATPNVKDF
ncbi:MAG: RNA pyrophosphohydrolase [Candidatus Woesebacteria bacterium GW2011_GWB1_45_5]|uniref:RNA pyrophosphohydrolase n=1 Tax=Candidatus Woesebacteria bacterium GW2011_GWB1_45_5 TaxID=1618581 RepID=A0A0G1MPV1_9BACT|nr:MAG: RNA pyrophosphohydrolase [Candidatus Woesebacteria bacterium GW2011_GWB1_45_5]